MNLESFLNSEIVENLGLTLLHSIWQIALIAFVLFILLKFFRTFPANLRYCLSTFALGLAFILSLITFVQLSVNSNHRQTKNLNFDYTEKIYKEYPQAENFPAFGKNNRQIIELPDEKTFVSIENLQKLFSENLSAVLPVLVGLWLFGITIFALRLIGGAWQLRIYKTREVAVPDGEWLNRFTVLREKLKVFQKVSFLQSNLIETPVVIGWLKPLILVPTSVFLQINPQQLETIIAHELIHIRRYDALVNLAQSFIEILFFYHPCAWWISSAVRSEREFAADEAVIKILENSRIVYASALANLEEIRLSAKITASPVLVAANGGNLMQRITKILQKNTERKRVNSAWSAILTLALLSAVLLTVFSFNTGSFVNAQTKMKDKKIAVGFVSIPPNFVPLYLPEKVDSATRKKAERSMADAAMMLLINRLATHKVPAIGFLQGSKISDDEKINSPQSKLLRSWRDAGLEIGIGNYNHVWFYDTSYDEYVAGVEKNEVAAAAILAEKNLPLRYFSYPYLNTGKNAEERNRFEAWLASRGITPVKYTIDNQEWMYSFAYNIAKLNRDQKRADEIRAEFVEYMSKMFDHYEAYSQEMFGRDIAQTMVLTPSLLVGDSFDELFGMIEKRGYKFVSMEEALSDAAYQTPENFYGKAGISWFERWQMARGEKLLDEPEVNPTVEYVWKNRTDKNIVKPPPPLAPQPPPPVPPKPKR